MCTTVYSAARGENFARARALLCVWGVGGMGYWKGCGGSVGTGLEAEGVEDAHSQRVDVVRLDGAHRFDALERLLPIAGGDLHAHALDERRHEARRADHHRVKRLERRLLLAAHAVQLRQPHQRVDVLTAAARVERAAQRRLRTAEPLAAIE